MDEQGFQTPTAADLASVRKILERRIGERGIGLLTTVSGEGVPHATWMGTISAPRWDQVITITSPDSRKIANIKANPRVEWLFGLDSLGELVYLEGRAEIITLESEIKRYWKTLPDKHQAFFLLYFNSSLGFSVVRTRVDAVVFCVPTKNRKVRIDPAALRAGEEAGAGEASPDPE
ncbi:MAG: pyridoxamine 5'-phosphate oxidase family protein [Akkermansiaceae bacterium]|nr:pyridoxamine 5'-phosphate oxidase family protein [Akkermansiaceae bacterium]NNM28570.1 pyridoxamine 5'-phosphate oxidase family protein [Akkermansiaceae bacterium]